jgi:hypothetical protein
MPVSVLTALSAVALSISLFCAHASGLAISYQYPVHRPPSRPAPAATCVPAAGLMLACPTSGPIMQDLFATDLQRSQADATAGDR